jgi:hypothetical protein
MPFDHSNKPLRMTRARCTFATISSLQFLFASSDSSQKQMAQKTQQNLTKLGESVFKDEEKVVCELALKL